MSDSWAWYRAAIAAKNEGRPLPPVSADKPEFGFFWARASKQGGRIPVCIYADGNGELVARWGTRAEHRLEDPGARWTWIADQPCERDAYKFAWETGAWPCGTGTTAAATVGDNLPTDPFDRLQAEVSDTLDRAETFLNDASKPADKTRADMARNMQAQLLALTKTADAMHKAEKQPHLDASRAVDEKFRFRDKIDAACKRLRTIFENWMRAEEANARAEAERKHREAVARAEAERARVAAERAKLHRDDPISALTSDEPELPPLPLAPEPVRINVGGGVGRAAGLKSEWVGAVVDYEATLRHFRAHPNIKAEIEKLVKAAVRVGKSQTAIPGVKVTESRRAA